LTKLRTTEHLSSGFSHLLMPSKWIDLCHLSHHKHTHHRKHH